MHSTHVAIGSDHAGNTLKQALIPFLQDQGIRVTDVGTDGSDPADSYVPVTRDVCALVLQEGIPGVMICGSGQGEAIVANKIPGIRAGRCLSAEDARLARTDNDCNVVTLAGRMTDADTAKAIVDAFLGTDFAGGRHQARVESIEEGAKVPFFG